jgi:hypothetical protein
MRLSPTLLALCLLLTGCTIPVTTSTAVDQAGREGTIGSAGMLGVKRTDLAGGNVIASGGGNVIASGGGNVIASGGGNVISAGGGNLSGAAPAQAPAANNASGGLIASASSQVIAAGSMNIMAPVDTTTGGTFNGDTTETIPGEVEGPTVGTITGKVMAPGALMSIPDVLLPLGKAWVGVYDLAGAPIGAPVETNAEGAFTLPDVPGNRILAVRTEFSVNGRAYYMSTLVRVEDGAATVALTPLTTVAESQFYFRCPPRLPSDGLVGEAYLDAFRTATEAHAIHVPGTVLHAGATLDDRAAAYTAIKLRFFDSFKNDIDAIFDAPADKSAETSGEGSTVVVGGDER